MIRISFSSSSSFFYILYVILVVRYVHKDMKSQKNPSNCLLIKNSIHIFKKLLFSKILNIYSNYIHVSLSHIQSIPLFENPLVVFHRVLPVSLLFKSHLYSALPFPRKLSRLVNRLKSVYHEGNFPSSRSQSE